VNYYFVYLIGSIKSRKLKTYVGYTNNLKNRLNKHNSGKGAKSTRGRRWKIFYYKKYKNKNKAMSYEYYLKNNNKLRKKIITKFLSTNPI
tara:strand:- start:2384 stop:2653 length:270 start_codon:yes stop_codon:yes gene_type:complete